MKWTRGTGLMQMRTSLAAGASSLRSLLPSVINRKLKELLPPKRKLALLPRSLHHSRIYLVRFSLRACEACESTAHVVQISTIVCQQQSCSEASEARKQRSEMQKFEEASFVRTGDQVDHAKYAPIACKHTLWTVTKRVRTDERDRTLEHQRIVSS
jgi:deoxyribodipyrimidine photolyase